MSDFAKDTNVPINDLISRQAVIDAIEQHKTEVLGEREWNEGIAYGYSADHRHLVDVVKQLPSAQPEIIRCKDCKFCSIHNQWCKRHNKMTSDNWFCADGKRKEQNDEE